MKLLVLAMLGATLGALFTVSSAQYSDVTISKSGIPDPKVTVSWGGFEWCGQRGSYHETIGITHNITYGAPCCDVYKVVDDGIEYEQTLQYWCKDSDNKLICMGDNAVCAKDWEAIAIFSVWGGGILVASLVLCCCLDQSYDDTPKETIASGPIIILFLFAIAPVVLAFRINDTLDNSDPAIGNYDLQNISVWFTFIFSAGILIVSAFLVWRSCKKRNDTNSDSKLSDAAGGGPAGYRKVRFNIA